MKKRSLIITLIVLIVIFLSVILLLIFNKEEVSQENIPNITDERVKELIYNSYVYYILSQGEIPLGEAITTAEDKTYYAVDLDIKGIEHINNIINDTMIEEKRNALRIDLFGNESRNFISIDETLYVALPIPGEFCIIKNISYDGEYTLNKISSQEVRISYLDFEVSAFWEKDNWYLNNAIFYCKK